MAQVFLWEVEMRLLCINSGIWCSVMMTLRFGIITITTVQSIQMTTLLSLVQIDASGMLLHWQWHLAIENAFKQHSSVLLCCSTLLKCCMHNTYSSSTCFYGGGHGMTWDGGLFIVILLALSLSYSLSSLTGSMPWTVTEWSQPSSAFSVRSKRRRVSFYFTSSLCVLQSAQVVTQCWDVVCLLFQFPWHQVTFLMALQRTLLIDYWLYFYIEQISLHVLCMLRFKIILNMHYRGVRYNYHDIMFCVGLAKVTC